MRRPLTDSKNNLKPEYKERCLNLERYSRDFNLNFLNIPEEMDENCVAKLQSLLYNTLGYEANIENAHSGQGVNDRENQSILLLNFYTDRRGERYSLTKETWVTMCGWLKT